MHHVELSTNQVLEAHHCGGKAELELFSYFNVGQMHT